MSKGHAPSLPRKGTVYRLDTNGRRIVQGIKHSRNGYTNYKCRCKKCTAAQRAYQEDWRARQVA